MEEKTRKTITVISEDGSTKTVEVIVAFKFKDTEQEYIVYTQNEKDQNNNITVYVSKIVDEDGTSRLAGIEDDNEWSKVKEVLRELAKGE